MTKTSITISALVGIFFVVGGIIAANHAGDFVGVSAIGFFVGLGAWVLWNAIVYGWPIQKRERKEQEHKRQEALR
jgi:hypothetical protein